MWGDGFVYRGEFRDNYMEGYGELNSAEGTVYKGNWKNDLKHGKGRVVC